VHPPKETDHAEARGRRERSTAPAKHTWCERDIRDRSLSMKKYAEYPTRGTLDLCSNFSLHLSPGHVVDG